MFYFFKRTYTFVKFLALTALVIGTTVLLVTLARGYIFNPETGQFEAGGLLMLGSSPNRADIYIDSKAEAVTPGRFLLGDGNYLVELNRPGYRQWRKNIRVRENEVVWARYPFLVPNNVGTEAVESLRDPRLLAQSPDRRYIAIAEGGNDPGVIVYDSRSGGINVLHQLNGDTPGDLRSMKWSPDSEMLLLETIIPGERVGHWQVIEVANPGSEGGAESPSPIVARQAEFSSDSDSVYFLNQGTLSRYDLSSGSSVELTAPVQAFAHYGRQVFAIKSAGQERRLVELDGGEENTVKTLRSGRDYRLLLAVYDGERYLLVHDRTLRQLSLLDLNRDDLRTETLPPLSAGEVVLSPRHRFIAMREGSRVLTYDMDRSEQFVFSAPGNISAPLTWFDEYHLLVTGENTVKLVEFDGGNQEELVTVEPGFPVFGDAGDRLLFSVGRSSVGDGLWLQISDLK